MNNIARQLLVVLQNPDIRCAIDRAAGHHIADPIRLLVLLLVALSTTPRPRRE